MEEFNSIEEMKPYYDKEKKLFYIRDDIRLNFDLSCACNINAWNIYAHDINVCNIIAGNISAGDINACDINACDITATNITACNIRARNIDACDINAEDIIARDISYWAVCFAYKNILCDSIEGKRENARHFVLDGELIVNGDKK